MKTRTSLRDRSIPATKLPRLLAASGTLALGGCLAGAPELPEEGTSAQEIRGVGNTPDTTYPAVGWMSAEGGCSMVRIGRNVALAAAHCMPRFARGCSATRAGTVLMSASGRNPGGTASLTFDDAAVAPGAYHRFGSCPAGSTSTCATVGNVGKNASSDLLLLHLPEATANAFDAQGATPMRVLTSLRDNASNPYGAHATLDDTASLPGYNFLNRVTPVTVVGWGASDSGVPGIRRVGTMQFESTGAVAWHRGCFQTTSCWDSISLPGGGCSWRQRDGVVQDFGVNAYATDSLRLARTQTAPGSSIWNGPWIDSGDSGGPAVVRLYHPADTFAMNDRYVIGAASHINGALTASPGSAGSGYITAQHGVTFSDENGRWVEKMMEYWDNANAEYACRGGGFTPWDGSPGGALNSGPGVASWGRGRIDAFVLGTDDQLWHWDGAGWDRPVAGVTLRRVNPAAASWGVGHVAAFPVSTAGKVLHTYWNGGGWVAYEDLGAPSVGLKVNTGAAVLSTGPGLLDVYVTGSNGRVYRKTWRGVWSTWSALPTGVLTNDSPGATSWGPNRIDVFVRGTDGRLWTTSRDESQSAMGWFNHTGRTGWANLGTYIDSAPAAASWAPGRIDVFARSAASGASRLVQVTRGDGGWTAATTPTESDGGIGAPSVAAWAPGRLDVFIRGGVGLHRASFPRTCIRPAPGGGLPPL